jgi:N4-gp56 family major capsid protein|tara:strand:+ start:2228 stop:3064 length:837 start_codon:yes stop_codon:yes gene_type:complete
MAASTTTTLNDLFVNIIREAIFTAQESSLVRNLVTVYDISAENGKTIQVPTYPNVAAAALTEGTDMSSTTVSTGAVTITAAEVGVQAVLTDLAAKTAARDVAADLGRVLGEGVAKKMDEDLIALFDGFSTNLGSAGTELIASHFFLANAHLDTNNAPGRKSAVIHPKSAYNLKANMTNTFANPNGGDLQNEAMRNGYVGTLGGIDIFESANISIDGSDDMIGAVFVPGAIGLAIKWDINMEPQRDASLRAWELNATACYGVAELVDGYGIEMKFDAAI